MGTCGQPGYVFRDFCLKQGIEFIIFELFFCKKIPLSRRVEYVMDGSTDQRVSESVRDVCMSHQSDRIYYKQPIKFLVLKANGI